MSSDALDRRPLEGHGDAGPSQVSRRVLALGVAACCALLVAAAALLWTSQGAAVFLENAFAAIIACF